MKNILFSPKYQKAFLLAVFLILGLSLSAQRKYAHYEKYISNHNKTAVKQMKKNKIPASIILAQGLLESGGGRSLLAKNGNNHFGVKCQSGWQGDRLYQDDDLTHECFRKYKSVADSYKDHSAFLRDRPRYADLFNLDVTDYRNWAWGLQKAGYATDRGYADKLIKLIEDYELYKYDGGKGSKTATANNRIESILDYYSNETVGQFEETDRPAVIMTDAFPVYTEEADKQGTDRERITRSKPFEVERKTSPRRKETKTQTIENDVVEGFSVEDEESQKPKTQTEKLEQHPVSTNESSLSELDMESMLSRAIHNNEGLEYVIAEFGDTFEKLAKEFDVKVKDLYKYNEIPEGYPIQAGDYIYLQKKRSKANKPNYEHIIEYGDSMHSISQQYGIRLGNLYKMNKKNSDYAPERGEVLKLR